MNEYKLNDILSDLSDEQQIVCKSEGNILLTAGPGSGKTRTITHKVAYNSVKYEDSRLLNVSLTYTNIAANELESRILDMGINLDTIWCGTIHQFCLEYIINPYRMYHPEISKGYTIIDEYQSSKYIREILRDNKFSKYYNDLNSRQKNIVDKSYDDLLKQEKELDFNKILKISNQMLEKNNFIALNISKIIRAINIDEYQDTNKLQYEIISKIYKSKPEITIMLVGDSNQAIYSGIGAVLKSEEQLSLLFETEFQHLSLSDCYRSTQRMIDYYNEFENNKSSIYSTSKNQLDRGIISYNTTTSKEELKFKIAEIIRLELNRGIDPNEICVVGPQWRFILPMGEDLKELLPNTKFDAPNVKIVKYNSMNIFYLITWIIFTRNFKSSFRRRQYARKIHEILRDEYSLNNSNNYNYLDILSIINTVDYIRDNALETMKISFTKLFEKLNIGNKEQAFKNMKLFIEDTENRVKKNRLNIDCDSVVRSFAEKTGVVINSLHGVKGEEYETVIAFGLLEGRVPNWNLIFDASLSSTYINHSTKNLLYVMASRSKKNLYMFSELGYKTQKGGNYKPTKILHEYNYEYD